MVGVNHENLSAAKYGAISVLTSMSSIPLEDTTQIGQIVAIIVSLISGFTSLFKLFKKK